MTSPSEPAYRRPEKPVVARIKVNLSFNGRKGKEGESEIVIYTDDDREAVERKIGWLFYQTWAAVKDAQLL